MLEMLNFTIEPISIYPGATSQSISNHRSCTMVVSSGLWLIACHFRKFGGRCKQFKVVVKYVLEDRN